MRSRVFLTALFNELRKAHHHHTLYTMNHTPPLKVKRLEVKRIDSCQRIMTHMYKRILLLDHVDVMLRSCLALEALDKGL
jgi:hypothetical protein